MRKQYTGLDVEVVNMGNEDITTKSIPASCFEIIANTVVPGTRVCTNPEDNTSYKWYGDNPYE